MSQWKVVSVEPMPPVKATCGAEGDEGAWITVTGPPMEITYTLRLEKRAQCFINTCTKEAIGGVRVPDVVLDIATATVTVRYVKDGDVVKAMRVSGKVDGSPPMHTIEAMIGDFLRGHEPPLLWD